MNTLEIKKLVEEFEVETIKEVKQVEKFVPREPSNFSEKLQAKLKGKEFFDIIIDEEVTYTEPVDDMYQAVKKMHDEIRDDYSILKVISFHRDNNTPTWRVLADL